MVAEFGLNVEVVGPNPEFFPQHVKYKAQSSKIGTQLLSVLLKYSNKFDTNMDENN